MLSFTKKLIKIHGMAQIHEALRNARSQESALSFEGVSPNTNAKWPTGPTGLTQTWPTGQQLLEEIQQVTGLDKWEPGIVDMADDFFLPFHSTRQSKQLFQPDSRSAFGQYRSKIHLEP
jgi:hypothetical protein